MNRAITFILNGRDGASVAIQNVTRSLGKLQGTALSLRSTLAGAFAGFGAFEAGKFIVGQTTAMENLQTQFTTMLRSGDLAKSLMADLNKFAAFTPFETGELADATKKLLAFGFAQQQVIPTLTRLGDVASGLGIPLGELAEIYGKARVQGRLFAEDVNQLTGRGIPVIQEFAKQFGVAESEVRKLVEQGKIGFTQLERAIESLTSQGGMFAGGMKSLSETLAGKWSTISDSIKQSANDLGQLMLPTMKELVDLAGQYIDRLRGKPSQAEKLSEAENRIREINRMGPIGNWANQQIANILGFEGVNAEKERLKREVEKISGEMAAETVRGVDEARRKRQEEAGLLDTRTAEQRKQDSEALFRRREAEWKQRQKDEAVWNQPERSGIVTDAVNEFAKQFAKFGEMQNRARESMQEAIGKGERFAMKNNEAFDKRQKLKEEARDRKVSNEAGILAAEESRFLTRGRGAIDPAIREQQKANKLHQEALKELKDQNKQLKKLTAIKSNDITHFEVT